MKLWVPLLLVVVVLGGCDVVNKYLPTAANVTPVNTTPPAAQVVQTNSTPPPPPPPPEGLLSALLPRPGNLTVFMSKSSSTQIALITFPTGENFLIDGGTSTDASNMEIFMRNLGVGKLDGVIATGTLPENVQGLPYLMTRFHATKLYYSAFPSTDNLYLQYPAEHIPVPIDDTVRIGDVVAELYAPYKTNGFTGIPNDNVLAVRLLYGAQSFLFVNNCNVACQSLLSSELAQKATVLFLGGHGDCNVNSLLLLKDTLPEKIVYGYPDALCSTVYQSLEYLGNVSLTELNKGDLMITTDGLRSTVGYKP